MRLGDDHDSVRSQHFSLCISSLPDPADDREGHPAVVWGHTGSVVHRIGFLSAYACGWVRVCRLARKTGAIQSSKSGSPFVNCLCSRLSRVALHNLEFARNSRFELETSNCEFADRRYLQTADGFGWTAVFHPKLKWSVDASMVQPGIPGSVLYAAVFAIEFGFGVGPIDVPRLN